MYLCSQSSLKFMACMLREIGRRSDGTSSSDAPQRRWTSPRASVCATRQSQCPHACPNGSPQSEESWTDTEIAQALDLSEQMIRKIRQRFRAGGVEAVLTDKRQARRVSQACLGQILCLAITR